MSNECKIEYYFKREELEKLLKNHPDAKGVIVSLQIVREKPKGSLNYVNVTHIKAHADKNLSSSKMMGDPGDDSGINGCPYPPGCTE